MEAQKGRGRKSTSRSKLRADGRTETLAAPWTDNPGPICFFHHWTTLKTSQPERTCAISSKAWNQSSITQLQIWSNPQFSDLLWICNGFSEIKFLPNKSLELEMKTRRKDQALTGEGYVEASLLHGVVSLELQPSYVTTAGQRGGDLASWEGPQHRRFSSPTILHG